jgi:hypothetical protein
MRINSGGAAHPAPHQTAPPTGRAPRSFTAVLDERLAAAPTRTAPAAAAPAPHAAAEARAPVRRMLERVISSEDRIDALVQAAARGKTFSPAELLALQAAVFRYSQTVEVVSRVADRLVGAVKQTMGTQI